MCGALQLGENEPTPITGDLLVFTPFCLTLLTPPPSVPQIWDSRSLSSACPCHCSTGGYRLEELLLAVHEENGLVASFDSVIIAHFKTYNLLNLFTQLLGNSRRCKYL